MTLPIDRLLEDYRDGKLCFVGMEFSGGALRRAVLTGVRFDNCVFDNVQFIDCRIDQANWSQCTMRLCSFTGSLLNDVVFNVCELEHIQAFGVYVRTIEFRETRLADVDFSGSEMSRLSVTDDSVLQGASFESCRVDECVMEGVQAEGCSFKGTVLAKGCFRGAVLSDADFSGALLRQADFEGATVKGGAFLDADLVRANLAGADISQATMCRARMCSASLENTTIDGADLDRANVTGLVLSGFTNLLDARWEALVYRRGVFRRKDVLSGTKRLPLVAGRRMVVSLSVPALCGGMHDCFMQFLYLLSTLGVQSRITHGPLVASTLELSVGDVSAENAVLRLCRVVALLGRSLEVFTEPSWLSARLEDGTLRRWIESGADPDSDPSSKGDVSVVGAGVFYE